MNFDDLQKNWQAQPAGARITISPETLLQEVRRNQCNFAVIILMRDLREIGLSALVAVFFAWQRWQHREWSASLLVLACAWVGGYMLVDRWQQRRHRPVLNDPLKECVTHSWQEVNHQIRLLKNILWWYLLPFDAGLAAYILIPLARTWHHGFDAFCDIGFVAVVCALLTCFLYWLNQYAVRKYLEPRQQELVELLASLEASPPPDAKP